MTVATHRDKVRISDGTNQIEPGLMSSRDGTVASGFPKGMKTNSEMACRMRCRMANLPLARFETTRLVEDSFLALFQGGDSAR